MTLACIAAHCHLSSQSTSPFFCCLPSPPPLAICFHCLSCQLVLARLASYACKYVLPMTSQDCVSGLHSQPFPAAHQNLSTLLPPALFTSFQYLTCWPLLTFMLDHICHLSLPDCLLPPAVASPLPPLCTSFAPYAGCVFSSLCLLPKFILSLLLHMLPAFFVLPRSCICCSFALFPFLSHLLPCLSPSSWHSVRHAPLPLLHSLQPALATSPALSACDCYFICWQASSSSLPAALKTSPVCRLTALMQLPFATSHSCLSSPTP